MKKNIRLFVMCLLCMAIGFSSGSNSKVLNVQASEELPVAEQTAQDFAGYKTWRRVNTKPLKMESNISFQCAAPVPARSTSPHQDKFIVVYVNRIGQRAMIDEMHPKFPQGSVIVKEKLPSENGTAPELLTAMVKRKKGFNPASNDWEFFVLSGDAKTIQTQGKLENCIACHTAQRGDDFVFRYYLPGLHKPGIVKPPSPKGT